MERRAFKRIASICKYFFGRFRLRLSQSKFLTNSVFRLGNTSKACWSVFLQFKARSNASRCSSPVRAFKMGNEFSTQIFVLTRRNFRLPKLNGNRWSAENLETKIRFLKLICLSVLNQLSWFRLTVSSIHNSPNSASRFRLRSTMSSVGLKLSMNDFHFLDTWNGIEEVN